MKNWKTTSAGVLMISGGLIGLYFAITTGNVSPETLTGVVTSVLGGIGLIFAPDAK